MDLIVNGILLIIVMGGLSIKALTIGLSNYFKTNRAFQFSSVFIISVLYFSFFNALDLAEGVLITNMFIAFGVISYIIALITIWMFSKDISATELQLSAFYGWLISLILFTMLSIFVGNAELDSEFANVAFYISGSLLIGGLGAALGLQSYKKDIYPFLDVGKQKFIHNKSVLDS